MRGITIGNMINESFLMPRWNVHSYRNDDYLACLLFKFFCQFKYFIASWSELTQLPFDKAVSQKLESSNDCIKLSWVEYRDHASVNFLLK